MARRIPVVLAIQVGVAGPAGDLVGELAGALMMLPGCDLSITGPLAHISGDGTDRLMLEGISGEFVIIVDEPIERAENHLRRLNLIPPANSLPVAGQGRRPKIIQVSANHSVDQIVQQVRSLTQSSQIQIVSLPQPTAATISIAVPGASRSPASENVQETAFTPSLPHVARPTQGSRESLDPWLDSLVDRLDDLDL